MKIVLVDDKSEILESMNYALAPAGYNIKCFINPLEALTFLKDNPADLVISDVRMKEMTGIELLKEIKKFNKSIRVIIMTAYGDLKTAMDAINFKAHAFLTKPLNFEELMRHITDIEKEIKGEKNEAIDKNELKSAYENLKTAYDKLKNALLNDFDKNLKK